MGKIRIGIVGYGNLGKGVETALSKVDDMELVGIFSRRGPESLDTMQPAFSIDDLPAKKDDIDVLILCGSSDTDIPEQGPKYAAQFNTVDAFDTHAKIPEYFQVMDEKAKSNQYVSVISTGWDPGLFSLQRVLADAILPDGDTYTFWGPGISQGHGAAVRKVAGVKDGVQYTNPYPEQLEAARNGESVDYSSQTAHYREVYAVLEANADAEIVEEAIITMPNYFEGYETNVHFISQEELDEKHSGLPHGGSVIRQGQTSEENQSVYEFGLDLNSNPEFTAAVNVAYARAAYVLNQDGQSGAYTVLDIPPRYLSPRSSEDLRKEFL